ncbi:MAG: hypothetical protein ACI8SA_001546 [Dokdonia sp.]|jgi:hypothetical protein
MVSVFKTNIELPNDVLYVLSDLNKRLEISAVSIDYQDVDHVLRIEHYRLLSMNEVIKCVKNLGFYCAELTD